MNSNELKSAFNQILSDLDYKKAKSFYYKDFGEVYAIVELMRSNFGAQYYANFGYVIKDTPEQKPSNKILDISGTYGVERDGKLEYIIEPEKIVKGEFEMGLKNQIQRNDKLVAATGLKGLIEQDPDYLYTATLKARSLLGITN